MNARNDEELRIRSYLQAQAAKLSTADLLAKVRTDQDQLRAGAEAVPPDRFYDQPTEGEWSANEVLAHVVEYGADVVSCIRRVLDGGGAPPPRPTDAIRRNPPRRTAAEWWERLGRDRAALFERVGRAAGDEYLDVTWPHPSFGDLNWREWLLFIRLHDLDHARQLQAIAEAFRPS